ncbi:MAG: cohesin domain-containing protein [bacterium]|nr:cohesin domain-containing protein [bacterium]
MKKILSAITLSALLLPAAAMASSVTLAPATVATVAGNTFSVTVGVNPTSGKAYTVRANLSFDPAVLTLTGFSFASKWMPLSQSGYDTEDNTNGVMAKTGGYPGGVTSATVLGTATFRAKKNGTATISATSESLILDANNQNAVAGSQGSVAVTISAASTAPAPTQTVTEPSTPSKTVTAGTVTESTATEAASTDSGVPAQAAAVALSPFENILTFGTGSPAIASLVTLVILVVLGGGIWFWRRKRSDY